MSSDNIELDRAQKRERNKGLRDFGLTLIACAALGFTSLSLFVDNSYHRNGMGGDVAEKLDGLLSKTILTTNYGEGSSINPNINIHRYSLFGGSTFYEDYDGDHEVDRIYENPGIGADTLISYNRNKDFQKYPDKFKAADKDFREQMARFEPLLRKKRRN